MGGAGLHAPELGGHLGLQHDALADDEAKQLLQLPHQLARVHHLHPGRLRAPEVEQLLDQAGGPLAGAQDLLQIVPGGSPAGSRCWQTQAKPWMAPSRLLKSWAIPPDRRPMASILSASISCFSSRRASLTSVATPMTPSTCPSAPRTGSRCDCRVTGPRS